MTFFKLLEFTIWGLLAAGSVVTVAIAMEFGVLGRRLHRLEAKARPLWQRAVTLIRARADRPLANRNYRDEIHAVSYSLRRDPHPVSGYYESLLAGSCRTSDLTRLSQVGDTIERGRLRFMNFIATLAPLIGLAGTVVGIMQSLSDGFAAGQGQSVEYFGFALKSTLAGIALAVMARSVGVLMIEGVIERVERKCSDVEPNIGQSTSDGGKTADVRREREVAHEQISAATERPS